MQLFSADIFARYPFFRRPRLGVKASVHAVSEFDKLREHAYVYVPRRQGIRR